MSFESHQSVNCPAKKLIFGTRCFVPLPLRSNRHQTQKAGGSYLLRHILIISNFPWLAHRAEAACILLPMCKKAALTFLGLALLGHKELEIRGPVKR